MSFSYVIKISSETLRRAWNKETNTLTFRMGDLKTDAAHMYNVIELINKDNNKSKFFTLYSVAENRLSWNYRARDNQKLVMVVR